MCMDSSNEYEYRLRMHCKCHFFINVYGMSRCHTIIIIIICVFVQEMVVHALKQTNSRSVEAAIEYISRMNFQEPVREQITVAAARPVSTGIKQAGR